MLYFAQIVDDGPIKIGWTRNIDVRKRVRKVAWFLPYRLVLLGSCEGEKEAERALLKEFIAYKLRGEWFKPVQELKDRITILTNGMEHVPLPFPPENNSKRKKKSVRRRAIADAMALGTEIHVVCEQFAATKGFVLAVCRQLGVKGLKPRGRPIGSRGIMCKNCGRQGGHISSCKYVK